MTRTQQQKLMEAASLLGSWLTDNTEEVFEEEPDIDEAKSLIEEVLELEDAK